MVVKITDVAKYANVSPSAVSRVIHNSGYISKEKREIIKKALKELGYIPNQIAQGLKTQNTKMIGHILPSTYPNPFFSGISYGVDLEASNSGYHMLSLFSYGNAEREAGLIDQMISRMVDGIIFTGVISTENVKKVIDLGIPVIMVERTLGIEGVDKILVDNIEGAYSATDYLIRNNHKNIGFIGVNPIKDVEKERYEGYINALKSSNINIQEENIKFAEDYTAEDGYRLVGEMMNGKSIPSAIFVTSDRLVIGILQYLYKNNIRVPDDISIVGYDNSFAEVFSPKITTIDNPTEEMGKAAVKLLIDRKQNKESSLRTLVLHTTIIERESVKLL